MNDNLDIVLIDEKRSSHDEVFISLQKHKNDTNWASKKNDFVIYQIEYMLDNYGDHWYFGFLPKEFLNNILLPKHGHWEGEEGEMILFEENTTLYDSLDYIKNPHINYTKDCLNLINYLKSEIKNNGFNSEIILMIDGNRLKHIDGLHRMIALSLLIEEGYTYEPIPVYLFKI